MSAPIIPPPHGSSAAAWQSFLDSPGSPPPPESPKLPKAHKQHHQRPRKTSGTASSASHLTFPFLKLPVEVQVHVLAFLSPEDLHACLTLNRDTFQLITDPWPWKAAFLRLFHTLPLIALGTSWRTEYTKRTYTWRKLVGNVVNTYTGTRLSNISHVLPTQGNLLTVCDKSFGVAIRLQLGNGRQTQVGRYSIHGGNGAADINESHIALCKSSRIQLLLFGNPSHNTQSYRQMDLATTESPLHVAWVSSLARPLPSTLVVAYPGTQIETILVNSSQTSSGLALTSDSLAADPLVRHSLPPLVIAEPPPPNQQHHHHPHQLQPMAEHVQITHLQASTSAIVALTSTTSKSTLFSLPLPSPDDIDLPARSDQPRQLSLPCSEFGSITDLVYSAETHPLAILATSKPGSVPLLVVRVDGPGAPMIVAQVPHIPSPTKSTQTDQLQQPQDLDSVTAWAWTAGQSPARAFDPDASSANADPRPTVVLVTGDTRGLLRIFSLCPTLSTTASYTLTHTSTLSGHRFPITALHINATMLISAATTGWVRIWDYAANECVKRIQAYTRKQADREAVTHVCAWPTGARDRVAVVFASGMVKVLEGRKGAGGRRSRKVSGSGANGQASGGQQGSVGGGASNGGKGGANGVLGRGQSPTALHAEIQRELSDHRQSSHERQRLQQFATRLNGDVDLTEDEMVQLAMLLSSEQPRSRPGLQSASARAAGEWEQVPPEVLHQGEEKQEDWTAELTEEEALRIALEQSLLEQ